jgi:hypothetical protein
VVGVGCVENLAQFLKELPHLLASVWTGNAAIGQLNDVPLEGGRLQAGGGGAFGAGLANLSRGDPVLLVAAAEQIVLLFAAAWLA